MSVATALSRAPFRFLLVGQVVSIAGDRFNYLALVALLSAHAAVARRRSRRRARRSSPGR